MQVVDWYYQQQADFFNQMRTLEAETKFLLQYPLAESAAGMLSSGGASLQSHSTVVKVMVRLKTSAWEMLEDYVCNMTMSTVMCIVL
jgi:hypothetical protein